MFFFFFFFITEVKHFNVRFHFAQIQSSPVFTANVRHVVVVVVVRFKKKKSDMEEMH